MLNKTLAQIAQELRWGMMLYHVVPQVNIYKNTNTKYDLLVFEYDPKVIELFYKSEVLGEVTTSDTGYVNHYTDYITSDCVYDLNDATDAEIEVLGVSIKNRCLLLKLEEVAKQTYVTK